MGSRSGETTRNTSVIQETSSYTIELYVFVTILFFYFVFDLTPFILSRCLILITCLSVEAIYGREDPCFC